MTFLDLLVAFALAYLAGGLLTTIAFVMLTGPSIAKFTIRDLAVLAKVFLLWPVVIAMGVVFAAIMLAQRWHFAEEAKALNNKLKGQQRSGQSDDPTDRLSS